MISRAVAVALLVVLGSAGPAAAEIRWWVALGGQAGIETGDLEDIVGTEGGAILGAGVHLLRLGPVLLGAEAEGSAGLLTADLGTVEDDVTVWRGRLGLRATWWPADGASWLVPYVRAGAVYRVDRGDLIEDEGYGWYAGGGLDVRLADRWAIGPFVTYEAVSLSLETSTWLLGARLTFTFP
jgi:hypothetical protein